MMVTCSTSSQAIEQIGGGSKLNIVAPGRAIMRGECVAMMNWQSLPTAFMINDSKDS